VQAGDTTADDYDVGLSILHELRVRVWCSVEEEIIALNPDCTPDSQTLVSKPERGDHT
jgi:hypothetical protein